MHYGRVDGKDPDGGEASQYHKAVDQGYARCILERPWTIAHLPLSSVVPLQHGLGKGVLTLLSCAWVNILCLRSQGDANRIGVRLREGMARNKIGEGLVHTETYGIPQDVVRGIGASKCLITGNDIDRAGVRLSVPGAPYGQLGSSICGNTFYCLTRTGTRDNPDCIGGSKTAGGPGLPGIGQGGGGASRGVARILYAVKGDSV